MNPWIESLRQTLREEGTQEARESGQRFFREKVQLYGVRTAFVSQLAKDIMKKLAEEPKEKIWQLCEELWKSGFLEESFIASHWSYSLRKQFLADDFPVFEKWVQNHIHNWASCDTFCNHTLGEFVMKYPDHIHRIQDWTESPNRWVRRASAVTFIIPARKGLFLSEVLTIASRLLTDPDDMVQKGYGWMLKAASESSLEEVFSFIMQNKATMPRTALRYSIEKMDAGKKKLAMEKQ